MVAVYDAAAITQDSLPGVMDSVDPSSRSTRLLGLLPADVVTTGTDPPPPTARRCDSVTTFNTILVS